MTFQIHMERVLSRLRNKRHDWGEYLKAAQQNSEVIKDIRFVDFNSYWHEDWKDYGRAYCHFLHTFAQRTNEDINNMEFKNIQEILDYIDGKIDDSIKKIYYTNEIENPHETARHILEAFKRAQTAIVTSLTTEKRLIDNEYGILVWNENEKGLE